MAALTWREVSAPNFSGVADSQRLAGQLLQNGLGGLSDALAKFQVGRDKAATSAVVSDALRYTDPAAYTAALQSGSLRANTPEAAEFLANQHASLLANQQTGVQTAGMGLENENRGLVNNQLGWSNNRTQGIAAAQGEAAKLLASVQGLASSGDPLKVEEARNMLAAGTETLVKAGYSSDQIPGLLDGTRATGTAGYAYEQSLIGVRDFWKKQKVSDEADALGTSVMSNPTPDLAIKAIQGSDKDPKVKTEAMQAVRAAAEAGLWPAPSQSEVLLRSVTGRNPQPTAAPAAADPGSLRGLITTHEGAGDPDTLFGHAQKDGKAFAGVQVSKATIGQLKQFAAADGPYGRAQKERLGYLATPMGEFQIVGATLKKAAEEMGLSDDTVFDQNTQVAIFNHLVDKRISGPRTMEGKIEGLRQEWEGFKNVSDSQLANAITAYEGGDRGVFGTFTQGGGTAPIAQSPAATLTSGIFGGPSSLLAPGQGVQPPAPTVLATSVGSPNGGKVTTTPAQELADAATRQEFANNNGGENAANWISGIGFRLGKRVSSLLGSDEAVDAPQSQADALIDAAVPQAAAPATSANIRSETEVPAQTQQAPAGLGQQIIDTAKLDRVFNRKGALINEIVSPANPDEVPAQTAARLVAQGGLIPGGNEQEVLAKINETIKLAGGNLAPHIAGAIVANNADSEDLSNPWLPFGWGDGDKFSKDGETRATRVQMDGVRANLRELINKDGKIDLGPGVAQIQTQRASKLTEQNAGALQGQLLTETQNVLALEAAIANGNDTPAVRAELARAEALVEQIQQALLQVSKSPAPYTTAAPGLPVE